MMLLSFIGLSAINSDTAATIIQKAADSNTAIINPLKLFPFYKVPNLGYSERVQIAYIDHGKPENLDPSAQMC